MSAAGKPPPRLPLDGATEPHPDGLRIALGSGGISYLYPPAPRTQAEADAEGVRTRTLVATAVVAAANTVAEAVETEAGAAQTIDEWVAAEAAAMAAPVAAAGADALRAALEPPALSESEEACVQAVRAYLQGFAESAALEGVAAMREAEDEEYPPVSARTKALALRLGFVAIENTIARSPLVLASGMRGISGHPSGAAQKFGIALFVKRYVEDRPDDGWISATFAEIGELLGYEGRGGWEYDSIRDLVRSMHGCVVPREWVAEDGEERIHTYSVVQDTDVPRSGEGNGTLRVRLGDTLRRRIDAACFTYLESAEIQRLRQAAPRSEVPQLMWIFLATQRLPWPPGWPIFRAPEGVTQPPAGVRPLAEILGLHGKSRRNVVARIRAAATVVMDTFPEYNIVVKPDTVPTMYRLFATRRAVLETPTDPVDKYEEDAESVYEDVTGPVYGGVTGPCTSALQPQARNEPSQVLKSKSERSKSRSIDTGNGFPVSESEQPIDHNEDAEGQETEKRLEAKACPAADIVAHMFGTPDRLADFVSLIGGDKRLLDALALTVCRQFQNASGGAVCHGNEAGNGIWAAEHVVDGGEVEWCPAFDAAHGVALKIANYLSKHGQVKGSPAQYIRACMKRAADDPTEMMGRTREESKAAYRSMCSLHPRGSTAAAFGYTPKGIDD